MSLNIYTSKSEIPSELKFIISNDNFFNQHSIQDTPLNREILQKIDKATYKSKLEVINRGAKSISREHLSTGCKTLLNIANNPDKCFNMAECGQNVLSLLPLITNGNILWEYPVLHYLGNTECDIKIHNKHFTDFKSFLAYTMDGKE